MSLTDLEKKLIGGSDAAAVAGIHPYKAPIDVYRRIVEGYDVPQSKAMRRGVLLEPVIRAMYQDETGAELRGPRSLRHPEKGHFRATLDDVAAFNGAERVVEFKSANLRQLAKYGDGADDVPAEHLLQCQWYMGCTGMDAADLAVLIAGDEFRIYELQASPDVQGNLFELAERFWVDCILPKRPPPPDRTDSYSEWLTAKFPQEEAPLLQASPDAERWAKKLHAARITLEAAEHMEAEAKNHLKAMCGSAAGFQGDGWRVSWKSTKGRTVTDWEAVAACFSPNRELVAKHTTEKPGVRVFRPTFTDSKEQS